MRRSSRHVTMVAVTVTVLFSLTMSATSVTSAWQVDGPRQQDFNLESTIAGEGTDPSNDVSDPVPTEGDRSAESRPARFNSLWIVVVAVLGLLLVVRIVRTESRWRKPPGSDSDGNHAESGDV